MQEGGSSPQSECFIFQPPGKNIYLTVSMMKETCIRAFWTTALIILLLPYSFSQTGQIQVSGRITDASDDSPLVGVNVSVPGKYIGTVSNLEGYFYLRISGEELPLVIRFSMVGYRTEEYTLTKLNTSGLRVRLSNEDIIGGEVVITAPIVEVEQKTFNELLTVEMMDALSIRETPAHNYYEALAYMKGVDVTTQSMQFLTVNARGFNSTENVRFKQIVDGMDNQAPGLSFPVGNIAGLNELDVETMEFMPGPSTALYGNNSLNGVLLLTSKDPFQYPGLSIMVKPGVADLKHGYDYPFQFFGKPMGEVAMRYAKVLGKKLAFKVNAGYMRGKDWYADVTTNIRPGNIKYEWDPGHDGLNQYGDEIMAFLPVGEGGAMIPVARTGYKDKDLVDNNVESLKLDASLHFRITPAVTAILHGNYGKATTVYAAENRIALKGFEIYQYKAELRGKNFDLYGYTTQQGAGDAYDTRFLAIHLNRLWKSDERWFKEYEDVYLGRYAKYGVTPFDHRVARAYADYERILPNTQSFEEAKDSIINNTDFRNGARIINNSRMYELFGNYSLPQTEALLAIRFGGNYRYYKLISDGTIFPDTIGNPISFFEYGGFVELEKKMMEDKLDLMASLRYDASEQFKGSITPRFSVLYTANETRNFRISLLTGTRYPGAREQFINKDLGPHRYLGGLPEMVAVFDLPGNAVYQQNVEAYNDAVDRAVNDERVPVSPTQAMLENIHILQEGIVQPGRFNTLKPERVFSVELGHKGRITKRLYYDLVYYYSIYRNFIGFVRVNKPRTSPAVDLYTALLQMNNSSQRELIYLTTNSKESISIQGLSTGFKYLVPLGSILSWNATFSKINSDPDDPVVPGFNTPVFKTNISLSNRKMDRMENNPGMSRVGFFINWRYQSAMDWESPFASGRVDPFATLDWQISYTLDEPKSVLKFGVNNFLNVQHTSSFGGAQVGIFYYISYTIENLFN